MTLQIRHGYYSKSAIRQSIWIVSALPSYRMLGTRVYNGKRLSMRSTWSLLAIDEKTILLTPGHDMLNNTILYQHDVGQKAHPLIGGRMHCLLFAACISLVHRSCSRRYWASSKRLECSAILTRNVDYSDVLSSQVHRHNKIWKWKGTEHVKYKRRSVWSLLKKISTNNSTSFYHFHYHFNSSFDQTSQSTMKFTYIALLATGYAESPSHLKLHLGSN
jgi:hypothetical protein